MLDAQKVLFDDVAVCISDMVEKPDTPVSKLAQVGLYYLKDGVRFMNYLQQTIGAGETVKGEYYLPAVFMRMIELSEVKVYSC
jgi:glucose-1-phosphate thymidylyltransferase